MQNLVKELRSQRGWTQEDLADKVGVSRQTIISIESGRYNPSIMLAYKISCSFERRIEDVFLCAQELAKEENNEK